VPIIPEYLSFIRHRHDNDSLSLEEGASDFTATPTAFGLDRSSSSQSYQGQGLPLCAPGYVPDNDGDPSSDGGTSSALSTDDGQPETASFYMQSSKSLVDEDDDEEEETTTASATPRRNKASTSAVKSGTRRPRRSTIITGNNDKRMTYSSTLKQLMASTTAAVRVINAGLGGVEDKGSSSVPRRQRHGGIRKKRQVLFKGTIKKMSSINN
jgi:hypothetical protein